MRRFSNWLCIAIYTYAAMSTAATNIPDNLQTGWNVINTSSLKNNITYLASDKLPTFIKNPGLYQK